MSEPMTDDELDDVERQVTNGCEWKTWIAPSTTLALVAAVRLARSERDRARLVAVALEEEAAEGWPVAPLLENDREAMADWVTGIRMNVWNPTPATKRHLAYVLERVLIAGRYPFTAADLDAMRDQIVRTLRERATGVEE